jgi:hypothetical protein
MKDPGRDLANRACQRFGGAAGGAGRGLLDAAQRIRPPFREGLTACPPGAGPGCPAGLLPHPPHLTQDGSEHGWPARGRESRPPCRARIRRVRGGRQAPRCGRHSTSSSRILRRSDEQTRESGRILTRNSPVPTPNGRSWTQTGPIPRSNGDVSRSSGDESRSSGLQSTLSGDGSSSSDGCSSSKSGGLDSKSTCLTGSSTRSSPESIRLGSKSRDSRSRCGGSDEKRAHRRSLSGPGVEHGLRCPRRFALLPAFPRLDSRSGGGKDPGPSTIGRILGMGTNASRVFREALDPSPAWSRPTTMRKTSKPPRLWRSSAAPGASSPGSQAESNGPKPALKSSRPSIGEQTLTTGNALVGDSERIRPPIPTRRRPPYRREGGHPFRDEGGHLFRREGGHFLRVVGMVAGLPSE